MTTRTRAYSVQDPKSSLELTEIDLGPMGSDQVELQVISCGICYSDISMIQNHWRSSHYPLVPGHEVIGRIVAKGDRVRALEIGQVVGLGWISASCQVCDPCSTGHQNLCAEKEQTIVARAGGFADRVRCQDIWAIPLPDGLDAKKAGPLFCGGITVFQPLVQFGVRPTDRVGVVGIGGLGHLALQFLDKWGCEVTAFSSSESKADEARAMGADHVVDSRDATALAAVKDSFDFIISTVNAKLDWNAYIAALRPNGRLHIVGAASEGLDIMAFGLIGGQKSVSGSPVGSPATIRQMLEFCARHGIETITETFPMSQVNEALAHLESGRARYRVVLENDFS